MLSVFREQQRGGLKKQDLTLFFSSGLPEGKNIVLIGSQQAFPNTTAHEVGHMLTNYLPNEPDFVMHYPESLEDANRDLMEAGPVENDGNEKFMVLSNWRLFEDDCSHCKQISRIKGSRFAKPY